jgi:hypothetical protein
LRSTDGKHRLDFIARADGTFEYIGYSEAEEDGTTFWRPTNFSRVCPSLEIAERESLADMAWPSREKAN